MIRSLLTLSVIFALLLLTGCASNRAIVPVGVVPQAPTVTAEDEAYGQEVLRALVEQYPLSRNERDIMRTRGIVEQLINARADLRAAYWHVYVLEGDVINAAATRGNFIFVWSKMLDTVPNDAEIAAVFAHEIGHVLAQHPTPNPAEQANEMISGVAGAVFQEALATSPTVGPLAGLAGAVVQETLKSLIVNPESQRKELEADQIGVFLMADAGYDPRAALSFWANASKNPAFSGGAPEIFSSHPKSDRRYREIERIMPQALSRYQRSG